MANRLLTINIRQYLASQPRRKRPARISRFIRERIAQQTNMTSDNIIITQALNSIIQKQYVKKMIPLKVNISIDKGKATVTAFSDAPKKEEVKPAATKATPAKPTTAATTAKAPATNVTKKTEPKKVDASKQKDVKDSKQ
ncbi:MAG: hypothetical protein ABR981_01985 [Candidatus Micrarchaeaceae archaeon]|jgi:ribosomal protein L31E